MVENEGAAHMNRTQANNAARAGEQRRQAATDAARKQAQPESANGPQYQNGKMVAQIKEGKGGGHNW